MPPYNGSAPATWPGPGAMTSTCEEELMADTVQDHVAAAVEAERRASEQVQDLARQLADAVADCPVLWAWGDGQGGWLDRAVAERMGWGS